MLTTDSPRRGRRGLAAVVTRRPSRVVLPAPAVLATQRPPGRRRGRDGTPGTDWGHRSRSCAPAWTSLTTRYDELLADNTSLQRGGTKTCPLSATSWRADSTTSTTSTTRWRPTASSSSSCARAFPRHDPRLRPSSIAYARWPSRPNPSRLGQLVDRVEQAAPAFLDWRFSEFASVGGGHAGLHRQRRQRLRRDMTEFRNEVLLSVANRLDGLLTVIDRAR